jgi:hypothetical protein
MNGMKELVMVRMIACLSHQYQILLTLSYSSEINVVLQYVLRGIL